MFDFDLFNLLSQYDFDNNLPVWGIAAGITYFFTLILALEKGARKGISIEYSFNLVAVSATGALLGGRIAYLLIYQQPLEITSLLNWNEILYKGNLNIVGGYVGGLVSAWFYLRGFDIVAKSEKSWVTFFDSFLSVIPLGLAFGYVGVFLSNINKGLESSSSYPWLFSFNAKQIHPWALYLAVGYLILFMVLYILNGLMYSFRRPGYITSVFVIGVSIIHFFVDFWQTYNPQYGLPRMFGLTITQWFSTITILLAILAILLFRSKGKIIYSEENIQA